MALISCWEKIISLVKPLEKTKALQARKVLKEESFTEFLCFCKENGCFPSDDIYTLVRYGVCLFDSSAESNYSEEDNSRKEQLLDAVFDGENGFWLD